MMLTTALYLVHSRAVENLSGQVLFVRYLRPNRLSSVRKLIIKIIVFFSIIPRNDRTEFQRPSFFQDKDPGIHVKRWIKPRFPGSQNVPVKCTLGHHIKTVRLNKRENKTDIVDKGKCRIELIIQSFVVYLRG